MAQSGRLWDIGSNLGYISWLTAYAIHKDSHMQLKEKVAIVTGGGRGIGRAIAVAYSAEGAKVVITSRSKEQLEEVANDISSKNGEVFAITADIRERSQVQSLVDKTIDRYGRIDILVNNAGINPRGLF